MQLHTTNPERVYEFSFEPTQENIRAFLEEYDIQTINRFAIIKGDNIFILPKKIWLGKGDLIENIKDYEFELTNLTLAHTKYV